MEKNSCGSKFEAIIFFLQFFIAKGTIENFVRIELMSEEEVRYLNAMCPDQNPGYILFATRSTPCVGRLSSIEECEYFFFRQSALPPETSASCECCV